MHARHYSPALGRFIQPDPEAAEANLYGYVGGSPVTHVDPNGCFPRRIWNEFRDFSCARLANVINRVYEIVSDRLEALATNPLRLPRFGNNMSIESHFQPLWGEQGKLRRALQAWGWKDCDDPPPGAPRYRIPQDAWKMATRQARIRVFSTALSGSGGAPRWITDLLRYGLIGGGAFAGGMGLGYMFVRMGGGAGRPALDL
jgi:hypothetical protein